MKSAFIWCETQDGKWCKLTCDPYGSLLDALKVVEWAAHFNVDEISAYKFVVDGVVKYQAGIEA